MRLRAATRLGIALAIPLALGSLAGCGGDETAGAAGGSAKTASEQPAKKPAGKSVAPRCRAQTGDLIDALDALRRKLVDGLAYDDYLAEVRAARRAYAEVPVDELALACLLGVAGPGERALNRYIEAVNVWGDCVAEPSCGPEAIELELQRVWRRAGDEVLAARDRSQAARAM